MNITAASLLLALVVLSGCALFPTPHVQKATKYTNVTLKDAWCADKNYELYVYLWESTKYNYIIQEILLDNGETVVECFKLIGGRMVPGQSDHHSWDDAWPREKRQMFIYPGTVVGADETFFGFAMVPENMDGSVKTTTGPEFNKNYRKNHSVQGVITECDKSLGVTWKYEYELGKLEVYLPNGSIHIYVDPEYYNKDE